MTDQRTILLVLVLAVASACAYSTATARSHLWNTFRAYFFGAVRYLRHGIAALIAGEDKPPARIGRTEGNKVSYTGYQVLRVKTSKQADVEVLAGMSDEVDGIAFWTLPIAGHHTDVLVAPYAVAEARDYLRERFVDYEVMVRDVQKLIAYENPKMTDNQRNALVERRGHAMTWTKYHRFSDMLKYMEVLARTFRNLVELKTIGYSSEGLPLKVVKISTTNTGGKPLRNKTAIWVDGGMHGREWITSSVVMYILKELTEKYKRYRKLIDPIDWFLMPVANPDGYEYSHSTDRLWKKTRSKVEYSPTDLAGQMWYKTCVGVDLNQNFDFRWGEGGSSKDPCSDMYVGSKPFSEPESRAISNFVSENRENLKVFVTLHSYSQMWLTSGRADNMTTDMDEMRMATKVVDAIRGVLGTNYGVGVTSTFYPYAGCSQDWAKEVAKVKYSYLVELRDRGHYGFLLPAHQILPTAKEMFSALKRLVTMIISISNPG